MRLFSAGLAAVWLVACGTFLGAEASPEGTESDGGVEDSLPPRDDAAGDVSPISCWPYEPSNYDPCASGFDQKHPSGPAKIVNDTTTLDTDAADDTIADGATTYALYRFASLAVGPGATLTVKGSRPTLIIVDGDVHLDGNVVVAPNTGTVPTECGARPDVGSPITNWTAGGGGGGYGKAGGKGGAGPLGAFNGNAKLTPLRAGCPGGMSGTPKPMSNMAIGIAAYAAAGGAGGGALAISARGKLTVENTASIVANGVGGGPGDAHKANDPPCLTQDTKDCDSGGGGGGSGGSILLEGAEVSVMGSVCAIGGGGGSGGAEGGIHGVAGSTSKDCTAAAGGPGLMPGGAGGTQLEGVDGNSSCGSYTSCGGGGGGPGRIRIRSRSTGTLSITGTVAPPAYTL